jgi:hypothetical protein
MKSFIPITILALIVVASAISLKDQSSNEVSRKKKVKKTEKTGMKAEVKLNMFINNDENTLLHGALLTGSAQIPDSFPEAGIVFKTDTAPTGNFAKFLIKSGSNYFIPFRFISTTCKAEYISGNNFKYERFTVNVDGESFNLGLRNEYYTFGEELNKLEMETLCSYINTAASAIRNAIGTIKTDLNQESSAYKTNKDSLEAAKGGVAGLSKQLAIAKASKIDFDGKMQTLKTQLTQETKLIGDKQLELEALNENAKKTTQNMDNINSEDKALDLQITSITSQVAAGTANSGDFQKKFDQAQSSFVAGIAKLKKLAPEASAVASANAASAALLSQNNPALVNANLKKITP